MLFVLYIVRLEYTTAIVNVRHSLVSQGCGDLSLFWHLKEFSGLMQALENPEKSELAFLTETTLLLRDPAVGCPSQSPFAGKC